MPIVVEVVGDAEFDDWIVRTRSEQAKVAVSDQDWTMAIALRRGQDLYDRYCGGLS